MGNIKVGDGSVINAGSVVTKPVSPFTRVGGVPGREISKFSIEAYVAELAQLKYIEDMHSNHTAVPDENRDFPKSYTDSWGI